MQPRTEHPLLEGRSLVKHFNVAGDGVVHAVDDVSFTLARGETLAIVGESGCGKSTLARLLVGLETPTSGEVWLNGTPLPPLGNRQAQAARRRIQIVFQDPYASLNPRMSVGAILAEPFTVLANRPSRAERDARIIRLLDMVGLHADALDKYPHEFSGGQRQRIGIARALAMEPEVLICDEPVSALDMSVQAQIINLLMQLRRDLGLSCVFISHDLSVVRHLANRVAVMYLGQVVETADCNEIYSNPRHPYTQALLSTMPGFRTAQGGRIVLQGDPPSPLSPPRACRFSQRCWKAIGLCEQTAPELRSLHEAVPHDARCHLALEGEEP